MASVQTLFLFCYTLFLFCYTLFLFGYTLFLFCYTLFLFCYTLFLFSCTLFLFCYTLFSNFVPNTANKFGSNFMQVLDSPKESFIAYSPSLLFTQGNFLPILLLLLLMVVSLLVVLSKLLFALSRFLSFRATPIWRNFAAWAKF